jgi:hypothetical protein
VTCETVTACNDSNSVPGHAWNCDPPVTIASGSPPFRDLERIPLVKREVDWCRAVDEYEAAIADQEACPCGEHTSRVDALFGWLAEMLLRDESGIPPTGEAEFAELGAWFAENQTRIQERGPTEFGRYVVNDQPIDLTMVRFRIHQGARANGASQVVQHIRAIRAWLEDTH